MGGTLLRDDTYDMVQARARSLSRLREAFGEDLPWFAHVLDGELERVDHEGVRHRQDTRAAVRAVLAQAGISLSEEEAERVRAACCLPGTMIEEPRPGALEALRYVKRRGLGVALCTNVLWRTASDSMRDWLERGAGESIDAHVTSIDVGWRKPHPAMFERALGELGVTPSEAVMVGNSMEADIAPAKALGLRAVLVRSRETSTADVEPDAIIDEMTELPPVLDRWLDDGAR